jgi:F-type H+-transporting ATPase subunit a
MRLSSDTPVLWRHGFVLLNETILTTWILIFILALGAHLATRRLSHKAQVSRWQSVLEIIVLGIEGQIEEIGVPKPRRFLPFLGTLFLFIGFSNLCTIIPGYTPPTGSLSTTIALALCVFVSVPFFGIREQGLGAYLASYLKPTFLMLPFNIMSEVTRTLALAVRLFGNVMSGSMILAILLAIAPLFFPIVMSALGLLTGIVQAYIFSVLAAVFVAAAVQEATPNAPIDRILAYG